MHCLLTLTDNLLELPVLQFGKTQNRNSSSLAAFCQTPQSSVNTRRSSDVICLIYRDSDMALIIATFFSFFFLFFPRAHWTTLERGGLMRALIRHTCRRFHRPRWETNSPVVLLGKHVSPVSFDLIGSWMVQFGICLFSCTNAGIFIYFLFFFYRGSIGNT